MPKAFSDAEREYIKVRLKEEASNCLVKYGVRHTCKFRFSGTAVTRERSGHSALNGAKRRSG